jgi:hypothetical protein
MTTDIRCDECQKFFPTEVFEGGLIELESYL